MKTARDLILEKPAPVQEVLKIYAVCLSLQEPTDTDEDRERRGHLALEWWAETVARLHAAHRIECPEDTTLPEETEYAEELIARVRRQDVWGKILRGKAQ